MIRLIDPGDIGEITKPFVFLDDAEIPPCPGNAMNWHPHSGVGALTIITSGRNRYKETTGKQGGVEPDGIEWMASGKGVWHAASAIGHTNLIGYQVWMLLPPEAELAPSYSRHFAADEIEIIDGVRVILGSWQDRQGPVPYENAATLLDVRRKAGEAFAFTIEPEHQLAWIAVQSGSVFAGGETIGAGELAVFADGAEPIAIEATADARFLVASARRTEGPLFVGKSSVHSSAEALEKGEAEIARLKITLR
ncbi:pirin family protein [Stakelama pacifica]|uniref:pirin family protein n=1 Tax=Stakelama pacifica TaxID=517720 RepID=UPI0013C2FF25|nr:pirin family protein [Stakelama pacifica]